MQGTEEHNNLVVLKLINFYPLGGATYQSMKRTEPTTVKVKVTVGVQIFSPFTPIQTVRSYSLTLVQARNLILSIYLHLIIIYKINECRHA